MEDKIKELKRLQKEIDQSIDVKNSIIVKWWGNDSLEEEYCGELYAVNSRIIESNQSKIKQIIEEL